MKNVAKWSKSDFKCSSFPLKNCGELALSVVSILRQSLKGKPWNWVMVLQYCYFTLDVGVKYRVRSVWVSVHSSQKPHVQISPNILFVLPMVVAQFSSGRKAIHCVLCKGVMVSPKTKLILSRTWSQMLNLADFSHWHIDRHCVVNGAWLSQIYHIEHSPLFIIRVVTWSITRFICDSWDL